MKKKLLTIICVSVVALVVTAGIIALSLLGAFGYFSYKKIDTTIAAPAVSEDASIVFMSANIRRKEKWTSRNKMDLGDHRWYKRAEYYLANIEAVRPDILGAQEVQQAQYEFLMEHLEGYAGVVTYRDEKGARSESCPIFYNEARFELLGSGTYWLSETPDVMSKSWGAKEYRITTYVRLKDKVTGLVIAVFNAHPEWKVKEGRDQELQVLAEKVGEAMTAADKVVLLGDLNTYKEEPDGAGMAALASIEAILADSKDLANRYYGITFNNYGVIDPDDPQAGLDYN
ncbi:MAG: hypothetical protein J6Y74_04180 [Clostridia bacterium]|nr:hypothetical protein [Clostridia bacterium]